ncbi:MAG: hypothetical protein CXT73_03220 [Methanobacteriota archaeon]|jgi:hypothetical protein|nr:MAG: hypothetical protein CXT73_03220 [Euryarchaeota archaeon]
MAHDERSKAPKHFGKMGKLGKLGKRDPRRKIAEEAAKEVKKAAKKVVKEVHIDTDGDGIVDKIVKGMAIGKK